jgi:hypothetical protein
MVLQQHGKNRADNNAERRGETEKKSRITVFVPSCSYVDMIMEA